MKKDPNQKTSLKLKRNKRNQRRRKSFKLLGGMNNLIDSYQPEMDKPEEINKDIRVCLKKYLKLKDSLSKQDVELKKEQASVSLYTNMVQKELEKENQLIRQRKKLRYQLSDLISNSDRIYENKMGSLDNLVKIEKSTRDQISRKQKNIFMIKELPDKINEHIGHIFKNLINPKSSIDKQKEKMISIYNHLKSSPFSSENDLFHQSLNTFIGNYINTNFKGMSEEQLDNIIDKLKNPHVDQIKKIFFKNQMTGGGNNKKLYQNSRKSRGRQKSMTQDKKIKSLSIKKNRNI